MGNICNGWPVNENNEIVTEVGTGNRNITGFLPQDQIPVSGSGGVLMVTPEQVVSQFASPSSGAFSVTGNTSMQYFEIADLTGKLSQDTFVDLDITLSYTANTNSKAIYYYIGPNTSTLTTLAGTTRTSGTEGGLRSTFQVGVIDTNNLLRIASALGSAGTQGLSTIGSLSYNTLQTSKLYIGVQLGNAADIITCHCARVRVSQK
jgi:hypothetical protein